MSLLFVFFLCMEKLSMLIQQKVHDNHLWLSVKVSPNVPSISQLFFFIND